MKFLVISDIHGRDRVAPWVNAATERVGADAIIVLGDITHFGPSTWAGEFLAKLNRPVYAIPGNCDPQPVIKEIETHATLLHQRKVRIDGRPFIGLGGSNPTIFETPFELEEDEIMSALRPLMEPGAILVLHAPPKGVNDLVMTDVHVGSESIASLVKEFTPLAVLAGHIHEARGIVERGGTVFMNPGPAKDGFAGVMEVGSEVRMRLLDKVDDQ
jgi:uncharacterized protein